MPADSNQFRCPQCGRPAATLAGTPAPDDTFTRIRGCPGCRAVLFTVEQVVPPTPVAESRRGPRDAG